MFFTVCECKNLKNCPKVTNFWALRICSCEENLSSYSNFFHAEAHGLACSNVITAFQVTAACLSTSEKSYFHLAT